MLLLFASFALACTGADTSEVQRPVHDERLGYEKFLEEIGVTGVVGVPQPWITNPSDGDDLGGEVEVQGWSAIAKDVQGADASSSAYVRVYVIPKDAYDAGDITYTRYEVTSATNHAAVNDEDRSWSVTLNDDDLFSGENVVLAQTVIESGNLASKTTKIVVKSESGTAEKVRGGRRLVGEKETLRVLAVLTRPSGGRFTDKEKAEDRAFMDRVADYFYDASHGALGLDVEWVDADGQGWAIGDFDCEKLAHPNQSLSYVASYEKDILGRAPLIQRLAADDPVSVVCFDPRSLDFGNGSRALGWSDSWTGLSTKDVSFSLDRRGSFIQLNEPSVRVVAHELMHGIGTRRTVGKARVLSSQLPDLYQRRNADGTFYPGPSDYTNIDSDSGAPWRKYFMMSSGEAPAVLPSAFSQVWMGWLDWEDVDVSAPGTVEVPTTTSLSYNGTVPRLTETEADGRLSYIVLEGRDKQSRDDSEIDESAVLAYRVEEQLDSDKDKADVGWPRRVEMLKVFDQDDTYYFDPVRQLQLALVDAFHSGGTNKIQYLKLKLRSSTQGSEAYVGSILRVSPVSVGSTVSPIEVITPPPAECSSSPDLDLHAYLPDGTHIGMNYETGQYENGVEGALTSGDMPSDAEWILLPKKLAADARFEVSARDTGEYVKSLRGKTAHSMDMSYSVEPATFDPSSASEFQGTAQHAVLKPGKTASATLALKESRAPELTPLQQGAAEQSMLSPLLDPTSPLPYLVASAIMLALGLALVVWPPASDR